MEDKDEYIIYPIVHKNIFYNIITHLDLELMEVRELLDWVQENKVMEKQIQEDPELAMLIEAELTKSTIIADVLNYEIWIYKRIEKNG